MIHEEGVGLNGSALTEDGFENAFSTRAQFRVQFPLDKVGQTIHIDARLVNSSEPDKRSPFSGVVRMVVS